MANQEGNEGNKIQTGVFSQSSTPSPPITELGLFRPRRQSSCPERVLSLLEAVEVEDNNTSKKNGAEARAADSNGFPDGGTTIGEKIGELYDKKGLYSDVQFIVGLSSSSSSELSEPSSSSSTSQSQTSTSSMERRATHHEVETIPAHKLILALATPVFASMFFSDLAESSSSDKIRVPDCTPSAFKIALQFIYKGKDSSSAAGAGAELDIEEFADILYVARKYCLVGLEEEVVYALQVKLSPSTLRQILRIVEFYELSTLGGKCWAFIQRNTWEFLQECTTEKLSSEGGSSSRLEKGILALILDLEEVDATEVQLFEQLVKWAKLECTERELDGENLAVQNGVIRDMLRLIQFPTMTGDEFSDAVVPTGLLSTAPADSIFTFINGEKKKREEEELSEVSTIPRTVHDNINSLDQDLILRLVLEHVGKGSVKDLKNCRLVNHSWNRVAVQVLEEQHRYALALYSKDLDEFKNLLWRTQLSRLNSNDRELESLRLSFKLNSLIRISESGTEYFVGGASAMGKAGQILHLNPHLRVAFIDYEYERKSECDQEQTRMVLVNQELFNLLHLTSATLESIAISYKNDALSRHFEEFEFDSSLTFPNLTFLQYSEIRSGGDEMPLMTKHVLSIIQGAPKLTKVSLYLWDGKSAINSLPAIMKACADRLQELELQVYTTEEKELLTFKALCELKFPVLGLLKINGFYYPYKWFILFLKNNCPVLERLQVLWGFMRRFKDRPMLLEFPRLPNIIHFSFDPVHSTWPGWPEYFDYIQATFSTLMMGHPSLKSVNFSINLLFVLGIHLKKSGNVSPSPAIYPVFPNISTMEITGDDDEVDEDWNRTDLLAMTALVYHHTFPNVRKLVIRPRSGRTSMERVGSVLEHLCGYGIQILEIHDYAYPWLNDLSIANHGFQGLKSLKLFAPENGKGPRVDPVQLVTRFPALEFLQFGKQMVSANQIQSFRDMLKIFEDPLSN